MACLAGTAWATFGDLLEDPPAPFPPLRFTFPTPTAADLGSADDPLDAAISPDEQHVAFVALSAAGPMLWLRAFASEDARPLPGTEGASLPAWKRGGGAVSFFAGGKLRQVAIADGAVRDLTDAPTPAGAAWLADGSVLIGATGAGPLRRLAGGTLTDATSLRAGDRAHVFPSSADGAAFVYVAVREDGSRVVRLEGHTSATSAEAIELTTTSTQAQLVGDQLLYVRDGVLVASRIDDETGALTGRPAALSTTVAVSTTGRASFAASTRLLVTVPAVAQVRELAWLDERGQSLGTVGEPGDYWQARLSPDDRHVAVTMVDPLLKSLDVMTMPTDRAGGREKLSLALAGDTDPVWSPDGMTVTFRSMEDGAPALFARRAHDPEAPIEEGRIADETPTDWRAGQLLVTTRVGSNLDIHAVDPVAGTKTPVVTTGFNESDARWSPDGRWVAFVSDESGQPDVYAVRGAARVRVSFGGGTKPRWSADGRALFLVRGNQILRADLSADRFAAPQPVATIAGLRDIDAAHRSRQLLVLHSAGGPPVRATATVYWTTPLTTAQAAPARR